MTPSSFSWEDRIRVFALVLRMAWADGRLTPDEVSALRGALAVLGIDPARVRPTPLPGALAPTDLPQDRDAGVVGFVAAAWLAGVDGEIVESELRVLRDLKRALALSDELAEALVRQATGASLCLSSTARAEMNATRWSVDLRAVLASTLSSLAPVPAH